VKKLLKWAENTAKTSKITEIEIELRTLYNNEVSKIYDIGPK
jgi:hypothetical protein